VIFSEETVGGRERVTIDEERVLRGAVKIARLSGCKNFVGKREREISLYSMRSLILSQCKVASRFWATL